LLYKVDDLLADGESTWKQIVAHLASRIDAEGRSWLMHNPLPVMINRYRRHYYVSSCGRIRITVDYDQVVWDQRKGPRPNLRWRAALPDTIVVECKFGRAERKLATQALNGLPIRVARHSKYMNAVNAII